jgi:cytochrome c biogenesis protein CcmG, thiol:disulfide interchange protein DsbE
MRKDDGPFRLTRSVVFAGGSAAVRGTPLWRLPASGALSASLALNRYLLQHRMPRFLLSILCFVALVSVATGCGSSRPDSAAPSEAATRAALKGAPAPLAAVHAQANELLDGGADAFKERLAELKGYPIVVNKWGSWCGPCIEEFPTFQRQALKHGKRVAFLGVDVEESKAEARELLDEFPVSYPSYWDPRLNVSAVFNGTVGTPTTAFYDSKGKVAYLHQGPYLEEKDLAADIRRYAR